jgi:hypothetical protein
MTPPLHYCLPPYNFKFNVGYFKCKLYFNILDLIRHTSSSVTYSVPYRKKEESSDMGAISGVTYWYDVEEFAFLLQKEDYKLVSNERYITYILKACLLIMKIQKQPH